MSGQRIIVTVGPDGTVSAKTEGILGERCLDYVAVLEDLLDSRAVDSSYTADRNRAEVAVEQEERNVERA